MNTCQKISRRFFIGMLVLGFVILGSATVLADATSTSFNVENIVLEKIDDSSIVTVGTVDVDPSVMGVTINIQHPSTLAVTNPSCTGIFAGGIVLPAGSVAGGTAIACVLFPGMVNDISGDVMTFSLTRVGVPIEDELVTMLVDADNPLATEFSDGLNRVDPGVTNVLKVSSANSDLMGKTTLQFRSGTGGRALVEVACPSFVTSIVPADDGSWQINNVPSGNCELKVTAPGYLPAEGKIEVRGVTIAVPPNELLGGDVNGDGFVDTSDQSAFQGRLGPSVDCKVGGFVVDVNCNDYVDTIDLSAATSNFGRGTQPFLSQ